LRNSSLVRVTVVLDEEVVMQLRKLQAKIIKQTGKGCSFSAIVDVVAAYGVGMITKKKAILKLGLKHEKRKTV